MLRKLIVIAIGTAVVTIAGLPTITTALDRAGVIPLARTIRANYLTGTAIAVIIALLILLPSVGWVPLGSRSVRCSVCDQHVRRRSHYCPTCGSRVAA